MRRVLYLLPVLLAAAPVLWLASQGPAPRHPGWAIPKAPWEPNPDPIGWRPPVPTRPAADPHLPADPPAAGDCALEIALRDEADDAPVRATVQLWRLDAAENEAWTRGDQLQATVEVPPEGLRLAHLPAGRYRVRCLHQRHPSEDAPAFAVAGAETRVTLRLPMPRTMRAWLVVLDENGAPIASGGSIQTTVGRASSRVESVPWLDPRAPLRPYGLGGGSRSVGVSGKSVQRNPQARDGCYRLFDRRESDRAWAIRNDISWTMPGRTPVHARWHHEGALVRAFVGVSVPFSLLRPSVVLPDGRLALDAGATLEGVSEAVVYWPGGRVPAPSVHVTVRLEGYEPLEFDHAPGDALPRRTLAPR